MTSTSFSTPPILASTLLNLELERQRSTNSKTWRTGVKVLDKDLNIWSSGQIIGIASQLSQSLSTCLIAEHLLSTTPTAGVSVYIISPPTSTTTADIHSALSDRLSKTPIPASTSDPATEAAARLNHVQILQYLDIAGLAESLSEVSNSLHQPIPNPSDPARTQKQILFIQGLSSTLQSAQRRSGLVQTAALLSSLLRNLTHLSRNIPGLLILLELSYELKPGTEGGGGEIVSSFTHLRGRTMRLVPGGQIGMVLERGVDVLVVVQDMFEQVKKGSVVEVVKDREGGMLGRWSLWEEQGKLGG